MEWGDEWGELWGGAIADIEGHDEEAIARYIHRFKTKATHQAWARIYSRRIQRLENILADLPTQFDLERSAGATLDAVGSLLGIGRFGFGDSFYSVILRTQAQILIPGRRTLEGMLSMVRSLLNDETRSVIYREFRPKTFTLEIQDLTSDELFLFPYFLKYAKPATYNAQFLSAASADGFVCDDSTGTVTVTGLGFHDSSGVFFDGGRFAYVIPV